MNLTKKGDYYVNSVNFVFSKRSDLTKTAMGLGGEERIYETSIWGFSFLLDPS